MWRLLLLLISTCVAMRGFEPPPPEPMHRFTSRNVQQGWVEGIRLTHFDAFNTDTFAMRYYYNSALATTNHIVIFVGGEWSISQGWVTGGLPYELAEALGAGLFYTEHRYYGETRPTQTTSVEGLRYLTVDEALADLVQFIHYVTSDDFESGRYKGGKVTLVGCSYAGSMATWMRLAYPQVVHAAFSDSGPLHAQEDFPEYLEVISEALRSQGSEECAASVQAGVAWLADALTAANSAAEASTMFNTCTPINWQDPMDVATFFWFGITETFAYLVQYATPGRISDACAVLTDAKVDDPEQRLANWITDQSWTQPCIESRYSIVVADHTNTSYESEQAVMRLWTYQTCVEFGWYQTTSGRNQLFSSGVPLEYFHQMCKDFFSEYFNEDLLRSGVERSNLLFASLTHLPDNVVTVQGGHDPWSPMGPNETHATYMAPVYVVPEESHCRAVGASVVGSDTPLERVKRDVLSHMKSFVTTDQPSYSAATTIATTHSLASLGAAAIIMIYTVIC